MWQREALVMKKFDIGPTPIKCPKCKKEIMIKLSDFEKEKIISCSHCDFKGQVDDDYYKQVQDSIRNLQKSFSDLQKKINKALK